MQPIYRMIGLSDIAWASVKIASDFQECMMDMG